MTPLSPAQREILALHLDTRTGSPYWQARATQLGVRADQLETVEDLARLGPFNADVLRTRPLEDMVPLAVRESATVLSHYCTGGATAAPCWVAFSEEEFDRAFIEPFRRALDWSAFPRTGNWLYLGPTGAHPIGVAASICARLASGRGPFAIDFDPRWARLLTPGSFARERYLQHVVEQAREIFEGQVVEIVFATPPVLLKLAEAIREPLRRRVRGVHYGGTATTAADFACLRDQAFPEAVFLGGYGNSLVGMSPELPAASIEPGTVPRYATRSDRMLMRVVPPDAEGVLQRGQDCGEVSEGDRGRLMVYRFDRSFLILNHLERDSCIRRAPDELAVRAGFAGSTLEDPQPLQEVVPIGGQGLY